MRQGNVQDGDNREPRAIASRPVGSMRKDSRGDVSKEGREEIDRCPKVLKCLMMIQILLEDSLGINM